MSTFFLFFQIITKYIYELLQNECRLKKVTLPVSIIYFAKGIGFFWMCMQHSLWSNIQIKTRCARALCSALSWDGAFTFCTCVHLEMWFRLTSHVFDLFDFSNWAFLTLIEFSKCGAFNRSTITFLRSICGYFEMPTGGCREQKCFWRQWTTLTLSISKLFQVIF